MLLFKPLQTPLANLCFPQLGFALGVLTSFVQRVRAGGCTASLGARFLEGPGPRALGAPGGLPSLARSPVPGGPVSLACLSLAFSFPLAFL